MLEVTLDFETASTVNLKKSGPWPYAENPTTEILCLWYDVDGGEPRKANVLGDPALLGLIQNPEVIFIAHGAGFEKAIWRCKMMPELGWPDIPNKRWHDTQAVCAMKVIPQKLEKALLTLGLDEQKDMDGSKITVAMSKPNKKGYFDRSPDKLEIVDRYCAQDVRSETGLHRRLGYLPPGERRVWLLNQRVNERGLRLDMEYVRKAQQIVDKALVPLEAEFAKITGGLGIGQRDKIIAWAKGHGFTLPDMTAERIRDLLGGSIDATEDDEERDESPDGAHVSIPPDVRRILTIRQLAGSASIKKLAAMEACVCADGRARGLLQYHGTGPGRSAGRLLQPQNFPRGTLTLGKAPPPVEMVVEAIMTGDPDYVEMLLGPPIETVVGGLRHSIIADPGRVLISGDYAGIQARIVLAIAGQHDKTALMASGADVYCDMASQIYGRKITKEDKPERQTGKNSVLGLGFQMGWKKFRDKYGKGLTDLFIQRVVETYRKTWAPRVPYAWYGLEEAATQAVWTKEPHTAYGVEYRVEDRWLSARLPSGRKIWYFNPQPVKRRMPYDQDIIKECFTYQATKMGQMKIIDAFGGQLTENVVMGIERDIMTNAMFKLEANGFPLVLDVHDEVVAEPLAADADEKAYTQIMLDVEPWVCAMKVPIAIETWAGDRYRK